MIQVVKSYLWHYGPYTDLYVCEAFVGTTPAGIASVSQDGSIHFNVKRQFQRGGLCTLMVDHLRALYPKAMFCNDPNYKGRGILSYEGRLFLLGYSSSKAYQS